MPSNANNYPAEDGEHAHGQTACRARAFPEAGKPGSNVEPRERSTGTRLALNRVHSFVSSSANICCRPKSPVSFASRPPTQCSRRFPTIRLPGVESCNLLCGPAGIKRWPGLPPSHGTKRKPTTNQSCYMLPVAIPPLQLGSMYPLLILASLRQGTQELKHCGESRRDCFFSKTQKNQIRVLSYSLNIITKEK